MSLSPLEILKTHGVALIDAALRGVVGFASGLLADEALYRSMVVDPAWELMPAPIRLIGRDRLRWDAIFLDLRGEAFEVVGATIALRPDAAPRILLVIGNHLGGRPRRGPAGPDAAAPDPPADGATPGPSPAPTPPPATATEPEPAVGIDLGTTFSVVAHLDSAGRPWTIANAEGDLTTPSVVFFDGDEVVVGKEAARAAPIDPGRVAMYAKRDMGGPAYSRPIRGEAIPPEVIQSLVLKKVRRDAEARLGPLSKVVVTVPAYFNEPRRRATIDAARLAGLDVLDILNEPTAAALAYGVQRGFLSPKGEAHRPEAVLVYDLGGGTFDATIMRIDGRDFRAIATDGDAHLGGIDWDRRVADHVADAFRAAHRGDDPRLHPAGLARLLREAEDAKRALSARDRVAITFEHAGQAVRVALTRAEFEAMTADLLDRTRSTTVELLRSAGLAPGDLTRVLLVGGSTRMPMVAAMLGRELGLTPDRSLAADEAVAHGAAIYAGLLLASGAASGSPTVRNVNAHDLGVLGVDPATGRPRLSVLIPRNSPLPAARGRRYRTRVDGQRSVAVEVVEGGDPAGNGSTPIGRCVVRDLPAGLPAGSPVEVSFRYAEDGRIAIKARVPGTDREAAADFERASGLSAASMTTWQGRLAAGLRPLGPDA